MPILDWMRTDVSHEMPDKSRALYFERSAFVAFDLFLLARPGAEKDYTKEEIAKAKSRFATMTDAEKEMLFRNALLGLPGSEERFTVEQILAALKTYEGIDAGQLKKNLFYFLQQVVPVCTERVWSENGHPSGRSALPDTGAAADTEHRRGCSGITGGSSLTGQRALFLYRLIRGKGRQ